MFKIGDKIICINIHQSSGPIKKFGIYTISSIDYSFYYKLDESGECSLFMKKRFIKASKLARKLYVNK